jgi:hypothetical protein
MGLGFLVPAFLLGLAALAVPVIVHLRHRQQRVPVRFPSLMFLARVTHRTTERRQLTNRLLLLLRALAVSALVFAFARPFFERDPSRLAAERRRAMVILLDRSMSMGFAGVWDRALDSVRAALGGLGPGDQAAIIGFDETATILEPLTDEPATLTGRLSALAPGSAGTRLSPAFRLAREAVARARDARVEIVLVSDLQRHALQGLETVDPVPGATVRVASVAPPEPVNARVLSVAVDRSVVGRQAELRVAARAASEGGTAERPVEATLTVNGRDLATAKARLPASGVATITFQPVLVPDGDATASVRLAADGLPADDVHRFVLGGPAGVRVILMAPSGVPSEELLYLERALAISRAPTFVVEIRRGAPSARDLERAVAVIAADLAPLAPVANLLGDFVSRGGGLVAFAGSRTGARLERPWLPARVGSVIDRTRDRGATMGWIQADHPLFEPFRDAVASDFGAARYFRYRDLAVDSAAVILARFDDGRPALVEGRHGRGRVLLIAAPADAVWSDLPLQPVFLPLVHRLVAYAGNVGDDRRAWEIGDVATLPGGVGELVIKEPDGEVRRVAADTSARTLALGEAGFYEVRSADADQRPVATLAVNPPAAESDLTAAAPEEVTVLFRPPADSGVVAADPVVLTAGEQEAGQSWWLWLLLGALAVLAGEAWYAGRLSGGPTLKGRGGIA